jgi:predicted CoA-substrate-specific enzyme activase
MRTVGIDIGAGTTKAVLLENGGTVREMHIRKTVTNLSQAAEAALEELLAKAGVSRDEVDYVASTGYGRYQFEARDIQITEVTCHARGAMHLFPATRVVLDIGAQSTRAVHTDENGKVKSFKMNDRCAAGAGRFLERISRAMEVPLEDVGPMSLQSRDPTVISSICAVIAESEVINHVTEGRRVEDILMGAHFSIADRVVALARQVGVEEEITLTGGLSANLGMVRALETKLNRKVNVSPDSGYAGAIGAAVLGAKRAERVRAS